jgi:hypothetical protein
MARSSLPANNHRAGISPNGASISPVSWKRRCRFRWAALATPERQSGAASIAHDFPRKISHWSGFSAMIERATYGHAFSLSHLPR